MENTAGDALVCVYNPGVGNGGYGSMEELKQRIWFFMQVMSVVFMWVLTLFLLWLALRSGPLPS